MFTEVIVIKWFLRIIGNVGREMPCPSWIHSRTIDVVVIEFEVVPEFDLNAEASSNQREATKK